MTFDPIIWLIVVAIGSVILGALIMLLLVIRLFDRR